MLEEMSVTQLNHWRLFYNLEPFGETRDDLRFGILASLTANANRDPKKHPRPYKPEDFFSSLAEAAGQKSKTGARKPLMAAEWTQTRSTLVSIYGR